MFVVDSQHHILLCNKSFRKMSQNNNSTKSGNKTQVTTLNETFPQAMVGEASTVVTESETGLENQVVMKIQNETIQQAIKVRVTMHPDLGEAIENLGTYIFIVFFIFKLYFIIFF